VLPVLPLLATVLLATSACQTQSSPQTSRPSPQDATSRTDRGKVVDQLLRRCHNTLRGSMGNAFLELTKDGAKETDKVLLGRGANGKPGYLRITHAHSRTSILNERHAGRYVREADGRYTSIELTADQQKQLRDLNALLRAALLRPLYKATRVHRQGPNVYRLILKGGETWRLEVDPKTNLPRSLTGPPGKVTFLEHKATGVTFLPKLVILGSLGKHHLNLIDSGLAFNKPYFEDPETPLGRFKEIRKFTTPAAESRKPVMQMLTGRNSLLLPDPGDWEKRIALVGTHARELYGQGQAGADLLFFYAEKGKRYMAIPFEPDIDRGSKPFLRKKHQHVVRRPPQLVAVVYVEGSEASAATAGRKALEDFLQKRKLRATGPLRVIPYVALERGAPGPAKLEKLKIRLELPVRKK